MFSFSFTLANPRNCSANEFFSILILIKNFSINHNDKKDGEREHYVMNVLVICIHLEHAEQWVEHHSGITISSSF